MNAKIEQEAKRAITDDSYESDPGFCQRFARQVVQRVYGNKYDRYFKASAHDTAEAFKDSKYAVDPKRGSLPGDLLYKFGDSDDAFGHVGIRVLGNKVAENSIVHWKAKRPRDARGYRTLEEFGEVDLIVRLPR